MPHHEPLSVVSGDADQLLIKDEHGDLVAVLHKRPTEPLRARKSLGMHHDLQIRRAHVMAASGPMLRKIKDIRAWVVRMNDPKLAGTIRRLDDVIASAESWPEELPVHLRAPAD